MASVTGRARKVKQPWGGYIKPTQLKVFHKEDENVLYESENVSGGVIGMTVDYMTRFLLGATAEEAFDISLTGARIAERFYLVKDAKTVSLELLEGIHGNDEQSIINACKLVTFDVWVRKPDAAKLAKAYSETNPDEQTIHNIQVYIQRCVEVFKEYGPIIKSEVTFEPDNAEEYNWDPFWASLFREGNFGGYTWMVNSGDGDYLTKDTLWDVKVLKTKITSKHTLQLLMYWVMGQHSGREEFKTITKLGIFNPRSNNIYLLDIKDVPDDVIKAVEDDVICYTGKYVVKETDAGVTFDMEDSNGEIIANSVVYKSKSTCKKGVKSFMKNVPEAELEDQTHSDYEKRSNPKFEVYRDKTGLYCFHFKAKNGGIIANGGGHKTLESCLHSIARIRKKVNSPIEECAEKCE